ncbi:MAG: ThuA domain-containing protein, partial [Lentisphaeraceae bacterium]|nr:ThuA domain-containing protein [Lentisphaeraceae bacterium]
ICLTLLISLVSCSTQTKPVEPIRALLLTGGCCHDYNFQKKRLTEATSARINIKWDVLQEGGQGTSHKHSIYKNRDWAKNYDVIVHNECFARMTDDAFMTQVVEDHKKAGVGIVFIHCSLHTYRDAKQGTEDWRSLIGAYSKRHEHKAQYLVENVAKDHPIMQGFGDEWVVENDELYIITKTYEGFTPLGRAYGTRTKKFHPCIWAYETKTNKAFGISMGHTNSTFKDDKFIDTVSRGILWTCDKIQKNGKAKAGYEAVMAK